MTVFRISSLKHIKDLEGAGARLFGGRWNHKGTPCVYASRSRALALLEYTVNINIEDIPKALHSRSPDTCGTYFHRANCKPAWELACKSCPGRNQGIWHPPAAGKQTSRHTYTISRHPTGV